MSRKKRTIYVCGAFQGHVEMHAYETPEQALRRIEETMQGGVFSRRTLHGVTVGVDFCDYKVTEEDAP